jgi:uncharacterized protein (TIGR02186 family)
MRWSSPARVLLGGLLAPLAGGLAAALAPAASAQAPPLTLEASSRVISITPRYAGELVRVQGTAPAAFDVVLKLTSPREEVLCSRKGKVGPFWLSVGKVRFENVPRMFKIKSTAPLDDILSPSEQARHRLGKAGLTATIRVVPDTDREVYLAELIRIREGERLFSFAEGAVQREGDRYRASFFWPPDGPPGEYRVEAFAVTGGRVVATAQTSVAVRAAGLEAWVRTLAREHGVLYGLFAVGLAVATGLVAWLLFAVGLGPGHPPRLQGESPD